MPTIDETAIAIARVYADALLSSADEAGEAESLWTEMSDLLAMLERDRDFAGFVYSLAVDDDARREVLEKLRGKMSDLLLNTLQVLNNKKRLLLIPQICEEYRLQLEAKRGEVDVFITTAVPFPDRLRSRLEVVLSALSNRRPRIIETVDEGMIGGMVVRIEDDKFDTTVSRQLRQLQDDLVDRASREIHSGKRYFDDVQT
jgi:F-type H+-transporting ATPase subunit delta